jgi:hypothetical protein
LTEIPRAISQLQSLRELNLSLNYISALPDELFQLTQVLLLLSCVCAVQRVRSCVRLQCVCTLLGESAIGVGRVVE